jgi:four helix bundle protein
MAKENLIRDEAFDFALRIMKLAKRLRMEREFELSSQLWRAGTSIGANVEEAQAAQSREDFHSKMTIASKEAREALYWLRLVEKGEILSAKDLDSAKAQCEGMVRILTSIVKTSRAVPAELKIKHPPSKIL